MLIFFQTIQLETTVVYTENFFELSAILLGGAFFLPKKEAALWFFVITKNANTRMKNCVQQKMCITQNGCASPFESESAILVLRCKS